MRSRTAPAPPVTNTDDPASRATADEAGAACGVQHEPATARESSALVVHDQREDSEPAEPTTSRARPHGRRVADPPDPYRQALGLLVRREHSRRELARKLSVRGVEQDAAQAVLDTLEGQGYQDDARFAEMLVRSRIGAGYGPRYIRADLGTHAIKADIIEAALDAAAPDWSALAADALRRRYGARAAADRAEALKRAQFLQRRGFDVDSIRAALEVAFDDD